VVLASSPEKAREHFLLDRAKTIPERIAEKGTAKTYTRRLAANNKNRNGCAVLVV
jgi:hypothetical protein